MRLSNAKSWPKGATRRWPFMEKSVAEEFMLEHAASLRALGLVPRWRVTLPIKESVAHGKVVVHAVYLIDSQKEEMADDPEAGTRRAGWRSAS